MSTTDRPTSYHGISAGEPGEPALGSPELDTRPAGAGKPPAGAAAPGDKGAQQPEGASNELAASLTDRLIQFWRTGEMGDGEFLPDEFYGAGDKGGAGPGAKQGDEQAKEGASVLDFLPRRGPLPDLRGVKQRQNANSAAPAQGGDDFGTPGFGMFGPSSDSFAPLGDEGRHGGQQGIASAQQGMGPALNPEAQPDERDSIWGRVDGGARRDDAGAFGDMKNADRILGLDSSRTREGDAQTSDLGRRSGAGRRDSLWGGADPFDNPQGHDVLGSHGGGQGAFERIAPVNQFGSEERMYGEGFEMYREPAQHAGRSWDDSSQQQPAQEPTRRGPLPRQNAPVVTQEERPATKRKPVFEVAFIYGSALALAAAVMGAIYLSNEGRMGKLGPAGQQGMGGMAGYGMGGMGGMPGYGGGPARGGMAGGQVFQRAFEVRDVVGLSGRPIALAIVLPRPLGETDAFLSIGGLPDGAQLSAGTRMATGFWMLRFDDIEGLTLKLPESAPAVIQAEAAILRQDGSKSYEKNFQITTANQGGGGVQVAPAQPERTAPSPSAELPRMAADAERALLGKANVLLEQGDISAARLMLEHGAVKGCVECGFKLAQICDPLYLSRLDVWGVQPDIEKALRWYAWSARYGHPKASEAHAKLKQKILSDIPGN